MLSKTVYFPQFALSPYEIFDNKITVLDVNFFNPKETEVKVKTEKQWLRITIPSEMIVSYDPDDEIIYVKQEEFDSEFGFGKDPNQEESLASGEDLAIGVTETLVRIFGGASDYGYYNWHKDDRWFEAVVWDKVNYNGTYVRGVKGLKEYLDVPEDYTINWMTVSIPDDIIDSDANIGIGDEYFIKNGKPVSDDYEGLYAVNATKFRQKYGYASDLNQTIKEDDNWGTLLSIQGKTILSYIVDQMQVYSWGYDGKVYNAAVGIHEDSGKMLVFNLSERRSRCE